MFRDMFFELVEGAAMGFSSLLLPQTNIGSISFKISCVKTKSITEIRMLMTVLLCGNIMKILIIFHQHHNTHSYNFNVNTNFK